MHAVKPIFRGSSEQQFSGVSIHQDDQDDQGILHAVKPPQIYQSANVS